MNKANNGNEQPGSQASRHSASAIQDWLVARLSEILMVSPERIDVTAPLKNYGLSSIDAIGLSGDLEDWLQRELSPTLMYTYPTIAHLAAHLAGASSSITAITALEEETTSSRNDEPIAIVGMACRFPGGANTPEAFWQLLKQGRNTATEVPAERWQVDEYYDPSPNAAGKMYTRHGCFVSNIDQFDPYFFEISAREALRMEPQQRLLLEVAWEALENAGIALDNLSGSQTGIFVGMMNNQEYAQLQHEYGDGSHIDDPYFGIGSAGSIAAGRLAYLFDLHGPTLTVDTACSSSLVALHLACQSLHNQECSTALVGGASTILSPENIVNACKMGMLSPDGLCKSFDASADGFVIGEGCSVVVLKRLSDARADGDTILALIRGSAVNQDGRSNGITAPNQLAQEAVIRKALLNAKVDPLQISYVEAHGSGTALGDPIEIEALNNVLGQGRSEQHYLAVGSVKTNIGHLTGAAGIAGLVKTVLALQHQAIPAHLNLKHLNPHVAWEELPLLIPTTTMPWSSTDEARIAGVSSFGWSGTNAHVILEEAPVPATQEHPRPWYLLLLSTKTESALKQATGNLAQYLRDHSEVPFADVIYTLQAGRSRLNQRSVLICRNREDALSVLADHSSARILRGSRDGHATDNRQVAFLFPGLGEHYVGLVQELYQAEAAFRQTIDTCCVFLKNQLGIDLGTALYEKTALPAPSSPNGANGADPMRHFSALLARNRQNGQNGQHSATLSASVDNTEWQRYRQTIMAQPANFIIEYALACLLMQWGIRPQAMLGYSVGEYVAACLAGVLSLEDALTLVARRAQLIDGLPHGLMLAVALSEADIAPYLNEQVCLAVINAPTTCVLAGPPDAIEAVERQLQTHEIAHRRVETTHAFHSSMLEPIREALTELAQGFTLHPPTIPYLSNVTGTWITPEQATDPTYWGKHMCQTVRFADGVAHLLQETDAALLEVGPGQALASFVKQHPACTRERLPLIGPTLTGGPSEYASLLTALGRLWLAGIQIDWKALYPDEQHKIVALPNYPFEHQRYWFHNETNPQKKSGSSSIQKKLEIDKWFYQPIWKQGVTHDRATAVDALTSQRCWLVLTTEETASAQFIQSLRGYNQEVITIIPGDHWEQRDDRNYQIRPSVLADYQALFQSLRKQGKTPDQILHLWNMSATSAEEQALETQLQYSFHSLHTLAQALGDSGLEQVALTVVSTQVYDPLGGEPLSPARATLLGPCKTIMQEYAHVRCRTIDLDARELSASTAWCEPLLREIVHTDSHEAIVAIRAGRRWLPDYESIPLAAPRNQHQLLRQHGVYLITGGSGGIGLAIAAYLAQTVQARLVLISRRGLPQRSQWPQILQQSDPQSIEARQISQILQLEEMGSTVLILQADVANETQMRTALEQAHKQFGTVHGVFHAAGVPGNGLLQMKTSEQAAAVLSPKVQGTLVLERVLQAQATSLDFLVLFSSVTAIVGGPGQADYAAANAFLDAYARSGKAPYRVLSVDWGEWQWNAWEQGLAGYGEMAEFLRENRKRFGLTFEEGIAALQRVLTCELPQIIVSTQAFEQVIALGNNFTITNIAQQKQQQNVEMARRPELETSYVAPRNELERKLAALWAKLLYIEQIGIHDNFFDLGGNSLLGMELIAQTKKLCGITDLPSYTLYEAPSVAAMARLLGHSEPAGIVDKTRDRSERRRESLKHKARGTRNTR